MYSLLAASEDGSGAVTGDVSSATAKSLLGTLGSRIICKCGSLEKRLQGVVGLRIWIVGFNRFVERLSLLVVGSGDIRDETVAIF